MKTSNTGYVLLVSLLLILWATAFVAIRHGLESFSPANLAFLRYLVASASFGIIAIPGKFKAPQWKDIPAILFLGALGFAAYNLLLNYGEQKVDAGLASFIINTSPFIAVVWMVVKKDEHLAQADWIGLIISLVGIAVIIFSRNRSFSVNIEALLIFLAAICQGIYFVLQKGLLKRYKALELTAYSIWAGTLIMFFFTDQPFTELAQADSKHVASLIFLGLFPGSIAYLIVALILSKYKMSNFASYLFLIPFIAVFTGYVFLKEIPSFISFVGGMIIIIGILIKNRLISLPVPQITNKHI